MKNKKINLFDDILKSDQLKQSNNKKLELIRAIARELYDVLQVLNNKENILSNQINIEDIKEMNDKYLAFSKMIRGIYNEHENKKIDHFNRGIRKIKAFYQNLLSRKQQEHQKTIMYRIASHENLIDKILIVNWVVSFGILVITTMFTKLASSFFSSIGVFQGLFMVSLVVLKSVIPTTRERFRNEIISIESEVLQEYTKIHSYYNDANNILNRYMEELRQLPKNGIVNSTLLQDLFYKNIIVPDIYLQDQYHSTFLKFIQDNLTDSIVKAKKLISLFDNTKGLLSNYKINCAKLHALQVICKDVEELTIDSNKFFVEKRELEQENQKIRQNIINQYSIIQNTTNTINSENSKVFKIVDMFLANTSDQANDKLNAKVLRLVYKQQNHITNSGKSSASSSTSKHKLINKAKLKLL